MSTDTYSYSLDGERYTGDFDTREGAIEEAHAGGIEPGTTIYTARAGERPHARNFLPDLDDVLDGMGASAYNDYDEGADDWPAQLTPDQRKQAKSHLDALADFIQSIDPPRFYDITDVEPYVVPEV